MKSKAADLLCKDIQEKMDFLDENGMDISFVEWFDEPIDILAGAVIAKGHLEGTVVISAKTIPYLEKTLKALTKATERVND